jgi:hypothetical protein
VRNERDGQGREQQEKDQRDGTKFKKTTNTALHLPIQVHRFCMVDSNGALEKFKGLQQERR